MKPSIPPALWEKKRSQIAKLYKDEEWPLKHVIKQIRTEEFNPRFAENTFTRFLFNQYANIYSISETQLRSRLKKWRVTKPSRQCRKKSQGSPPYRAPTTDVEAPFRSPTLTPPSSEDDARAAGSALSKTESPSPSNGTSLCTFNGWYPASEYCQPHEQNHKKVLDEQHNAPQWAVSTLHPSPARNDSCRNPEPYEYPSIQTISPIHTYIPQHSTTSSIGGTPVDTSPPLHSPFTESAFPELCFSTLPPSEYEWSVQLRQENKQTEFPTTSGYPSPVETIHPLSKLPNCTREPTGVSIGEYTNYLATPPSKDDIFAYGEQPSFLDSLDSMEPLSELGSWRHAVNGSTVD